MAFQSLSTTQKNKTYAPIILGVSILLAIFWAFPSFSSYTTAQTDLWTLENTLKQKTQKLDEYAKLEISLNDESNPQNTLIKKISKDFQWTDILREVMLNNRFVGTQQFPAKVLISQISIDRGKALPSGIFQWKISMNIAAREVDAIVEYLSHLTHLDNFAFSLSDINLPLDTRLDGGIPQKDKLISLPVTLGVYYYP